MNTEWPKVPLGTLLTDLQAGFASGRHNSDGNGIPHFRPMNVTVNGLVARGDMRYVEASAGRSDLRLVAGDILFNNTNSPELVGKTAFFEDEDFPAFSNHMTRLRVDGARLDGRYAALRLHQAWREGWFAAHCNNHVSQASIGRDVLKSLEIELPPLEVQRSIAALTNRIDNARASSKVHLMGARQGIEQLRRAILVAACSGGLTDDWREKHPEATGTHPAAKPQKNRRVRANPVEMDLPELPGSYAVSTLGAAALLLGYGTSHKLTADSEGAVPVLRMGNIQDGRLVYEDLKYCAPDEEIGRLELAKGDLLFNRTNSPELVGKSAVFHSDERMSFASYLIRVRFDTNVADPDFVCYWLNSAWGRAWARNVKTDGVSQSNINGTKLGAMPLPLPPIEEQREIVRRASKLLAAADRLMVHTNRAERNLERVSRAVLAKAFRGDLIPIYGDDMTVKVAS